MKIRHFILALVPFACFGLVGCGSGGVEAVAAGAKSAPAATSTASSSTAPKTLPRAARKGRAETPGPLPAPEV